MDRAPRGTLVLLHSPLTGPATWGRLPEVLGTANGLEVVVVAVAATGPRGDDRPPYAQRYVAEAARQVAAAVADRADEVVMVGHSGAGPLLPQVGFARRSAHGRVGGYVFVDAVLPRPGLPTSRLDLLAAEDAGLADALRAELLAGRRFPAWTDADLADADLVPRTAERELLLGDLRPRGLSFFEEPLPAPAEWPDAPCAYLRTSAAYDGQLRVARQRGWPVASLDLGHFAALADPDATAVALVDLAAAL